jgi:hypothetical protein
MLAVNPPAMVGKCASNSGMSFADAVLLRLSWAPGRKKRVGQSGFLRADVDVVV